jgi:pyruvate/2-oxoglutarate dehydrogenase complex dihydrolipoamide acyltransferase (E2) component
MPVEVLMPQMGESVVEATITRWLKSEGENVEEFEPLVEVNTDKVDTEIPSPSSGVLLQILIPDGATVQAGAILAWVGETGEVISGASARPEHINVVEEKATPVPINEFTPALISTTIAGRNRELGFISPVVARIASENHVDLTQVTGSGLGGRITKNDVLAYIERRNKVVSTLPLDEIVGITPTKPAPSSHTASASPGKMGDILPQTAVRRAIAEHMVTSKRVSPHVTTVMEADLQRIVAHRQANKASFEREGANLTFTAYFFSATVVALRAYPIVNSSWTDEGILLHPQINIGMATSLREEGLIVPVIKYADSLSLLGLARMINDLSNRARAKKLQPDEVKGGTFTITNHGISGSLFATPIINQPQCAILGVGAIQKRVKVITSQDTGDTIAIRPMAYLSLTFDHRILDGAIADYFLGKVVESLENWS